MAKGGKLKTALQDLKGVNHRLEKQKKLRKVAEKRKRSAVEVQEEEKLAFNIAQIDDTDSSEEDDQEDKVEDEDEELDLDGTNGVKLDATEDDEVEDENDEEDEDAENNAEDDDEDDEEEEDIPYSDIASLDSEDRGDVVPYQRLTINNQAALSTSLSRIALPLSSIPFSAHQSITSATPTSIPDIDDDLNRELAFYAQALSAVKSARKQLKSEGAPFARPADYFAEMVKSEEHMGRVKQRLVDDAAAKKASSEAKRQRDLKKFGKAVQVAKLQERDKAKKDTMEKISNMKRKRSNALPTQENEPDMFDIALDTETKRPRTSSAGGKDEKGKPNLKRQKKNEKYGFGGKKRHAKSGDAISSSDMRDFSVSRMKGKVGTKNRPGKARRAKGRA